MNTQFFRTVRLAIKSLLLHKLRSGLTMLGIVFGVFSVIAMLAIGEGASSQAQRQVLELGATNIIVRSVKPPDDGENTASSSNSRVLRYGLLEKDYRLLTAIPTITQTTPMREITKQARYQHRQLNVRIVGCTPEYLTINHLNMAPGGRFLTGHDLDSLENVCVVGSQAAAALFPYEDPLGKIVQLENQAYQVIGVTNERTASAAIGGSMSGQDYNKDVYIPLTTMKVRFGILNVQRSAGSFSAEQIELSQVTLQVGSKEDVISTAEVVRESVERNHPRSKDYAVVVPLELLKQADQIRYIFNFVLGSIAAISLIVGGIGIMNIMLATVTERTREIGIRRALGAKRADIINQFLTETIVLSGTGGLVGIFLGLMTPVAFTGLKFAVNQFVLSGSSGTSDISRIFLEMQPQVALWSLPIAFGISVAIGVIFGVYPARSAARLDPIEALRHE